MILALAWRNLWRYPRRTLLGAAAIACTCIVLIFLPSLQAGSYLAMIRASTGILDGYAQIQRTDFLDRPGIRVAFREELPLFDRVRNEMPAVGLAPRAQTYALLVSDTRSLGAQVVGVDPRLEGRFSSLPGRVSQGRYLTAGTAPESDSGQIVLGEGLARNLGVETGARVTLLGTGRDGSLAADALEVVGIVATGFQELDRHIAELPIKRFQATFSMEGTLHAWVLFAETEDLLDHYLPRIKQQVLVFGQEAAPSRDAGQRAQPADAETLVVRTWYDLQPGLLQAIQLDITTALALYLVLVAVVVFTLLNSMLMSVLERTREFGMLLALGVRPNQLGLLVWGESMLVLGLGLAAGILFGAGVTLYFHHQGIHFSGVEEVFARFGIDPTLYPDLSVLTLLGGPLLVAGCLALAGVYPWLRLRRLKIVSAMRSL